MDLKISDREGDVNFLSNCLGDSHQSLVVIFWSLQKLLTSASMKKKKEEASWQIVDTGQRIHEHLRHINVNTQEGDTGCTPLHLAVLGGKPLTSLYV